MKTYSNKELADIFKATEKALFDHSSLNMRDLNRALDQYKQIKRIKRVDSEYFRIMVYVVFYSGFKAKTVKDKLGSIEDIFHDFDKVANFNETKVQQIIDSKKVIGNKTKINSIIHNAKEFKSVQKHFGSFDNYLASFGNTNEDINLSRLIKDLIKRFKHIGQITVFHFLIDLGFNVVKPDRVLSRIFFRLGIIHSEKNYWEVLEAGRKFAIAANQPIRYIDIIFVNYGQEDKKMDLGLPSGICLTKNPICKICGIDGYCQYISKNKIDL